MSAATIGCSIGGSGLGLPAERRAGLFTKPEEEG